MPPSSDGMKRYNLAVPEDLFNEVQRIAEQRGTTFVEMVRRFIRLGILTAHIEETPGAALIIREGDVERQVLLV